MARQGHGLSAPVVPLRPATEPRLRPKQLARHLSVSERTIRRWGTEGLPSSKVRGVRLYRLSEVEAWMREQR